ncbi:MAG: sugar phosphate nucleotidyltransferase [Syntrophomonadaceae bacterium]|jgi:mannose-1-phosphate guanylyltransferase
MKAMIMAAGVGSRLMPLTADIPKPMVPMANRHLMEYIVSLLVEHGFNQVISNLYYHADTISQHFLDGSSYGASMLYSREEELMGTAGGVKKCAWFLDDTFVIVSGDALTDVDLTYLVKEHKRQGALATIAVKEVEAVEQFGIVVTNENGRIHSFQEKPRRQEAQSNQANTGIYVFEPEIFDFIPERQFYDFGKQVFPHLVKIGAPFYGVSINNYWCDVGSIDTYYQSHIDILEGRVNVWPNGYLKVSEKGTVLLGEGVSLGDNVEIAGTCVIGPGCRIEDGAVINNAIIWNNTVIRDRAIVEGCIIGANCYLGCSVAVKSSVIASGCQLDDYIKPPAGSKLYNSGAGQIKLEVG